MIAYFILVHRYPEQFKRLFKSIYNASNYYLIHVDKKSDSNLYGKVRSFLVDYPNVTILKSQNVVWGGFSMVDVETKAIKTLLKLNKKWKFYVNLSGQDFPLKSQTQILSFLKRNPNKSFMQVLDQTAERPNTLNRIQNYFTESDRGFVGTPIRRAYLNNVTPYIGGQWKILTRACCQFLSSSPKVARFKKFYKNTLIPDESFFQTVLKNSGYTGKIVSDDKRAIIWIPDFGPQLKSKHFSENSTRALIESGQIKLRPKTFTQADEGYLSKSTALFARKFDETVDRVIINFLEARLMAQPVVTTRSAIDGSVAGSFGIFAT